MRAALKGATRKVGVTAALAFVAVLSAPRSASAQYTLTFGTTAAPDLTDKQIGATYTGHPVGDGEAPATAVTITTGWQSEFGAAGTGTYQSSVNAQGGNCTTGLCFSKVGATTNLAARYHANGGSAGVGVFDIDPVGARIAGLTSFDIGSTNDDHDTEVRLYALDGTTLIATYSSTSVGKKNLLKTVLVTDFTFAGGKSQSDLLSGFKFEWGTNAAANNAGDQLYIDNLIFKSEIAPEPNTMLLLGTGLLGLAPLARRRRKASKRA